MKIIQDIKDCIGRYILTNLSFLQPIKRLINLFLLLSKVILIIVYIITFILIIFSISQPFYCILPVIADKFLKFVVTKFFFGITLIRTYYVPMLVMFWFFLSIKAVADTAQKEYKLINLVVNFLIKFPLNLCIFGFTFFFNKAKQYSIKKANGHYIFAMFSITKYKDIFKQDCSFDNGNNISKPLFDTIQNIGHFYSTKDVTLKAKFKVDFQKNFENLHQIDMGSAKQYLHLMNRKMFNRNDSRFSVFREDNIFPLNLEGKIYDLKTTKLIDINIREQIQEGSSCFAKTLYQKLSKQNNVIQTHFITATDPTIIGFLERKHSNATDATIVSMYDRVMYNFIHENMTLYNFLKENNINFKQISKLSEAQNDILIFPNKELLHDNQELYMLPSYSEAIRFDEQAEAYELKATLLPLLSCISDEDQVRDAIKKIYVQQEKYTQLGFPTNFLISIERPNLTDHEKEIILNIFNQLVREKTYTNCKPKLTFSSSTIQEVLPLKDSWLDEIVSILTNI